MKKLETGLTHHTHKTSISSPNTQANMAYPNEQTSFTTSSKSLQSHVNEDAKSSRIEPSKHAAITIASKNYISLAISLATSYKRHHPNNDFIIILVDQSNNMVPKKFECGAEVIEITELPIPDIAHFIYRYSIMELNTAVKPYALSHLFSSRKYETLLYLDPDIYVFRPLEEVYEALNEASIVLTPHMRSPIFDDCFPNETAILQSGTYNLGFIGLRNGSTSIELLDWWMSKLYKDCIVDIPNGLFVDQKWIDLVPGFFPDHRIIYSPAYNAAYWNLHERKIKLIDATWYANDTPLAFFHFSGYSPFSPTQLSKHQNRHQLDGQAELKRLVTEYRDILISNFYAKTTEWPYAFHTLPNGVELPLRMINAILQWATRNKVPTPNPLNEPDNFCKFLMSKGVSLEHPECVLLYEFILKCRPDVRSAYPMAITDNEDSGFRGWINHSGKSEGYVGGLLKFEEPAQIFDYVGDIFSRLRSTTPPRTDVFNAFNKMWKEKKIFSSFVNWVKTYGVKELDFSLEHAEKLALAAPGVFKILNIYFLRADLQNHFPSLYEPTEIFSFCNHLKLERYIIDLSLEEISLFSEFATHERDLVEKMRLMYAHNGKTNSQAINLYSVEEHCQKKRIRLCPSKLLNWLAGDDFFSPIDHFNSRFPDKAPDIDDYSKTYISGLSPDKNYHFVEKIRNSLTSPKSIEIAINFAGYLNVPTGMGEAARSVYSSLQQKDLETSTFCIPNPRAFSSQIPSTPFLFGWPKSRADISITVANADTKPILETILPKDFWAKKNVAYWLWETEELPQKFKSSALGFDEIWTSSEYAALAIKKTTNLPVKVVPLALDLENIDRAQSDRAKFGLPATGTLFGFNFDPQSVLERKNLRGLVAAFKKAFDEQNDCYLILKANGKTQDAFEYERIRAEAKSQKIIFFESTLSRRDSFDFMKSLDVYVSLHRSEGFGLTCAEAMALGKPVIASNYSGNLDFMNTSNSILITTKVIETKRSFGPYPVGTRWGDPDISEAAQAMKTMLNSELRNDLGKVAAASIRKTLSKSRIQSITLELLKSLSR